MARKSKYSASTVRRQAQKQREKDARANWRKLEHLGVVKKRVRVDGKLPPIKITGYKQKRLRQLAPVLRGDAAAVSLGPTALRKAREHGTPLAGRFAIVPNTTASKSAVREGKPVARTYAFAEARGDPYERAVQHIIKINNGGARPVNVPKVEKRISKHTPEAQRAIARIPAKLSREDRIAWWQDWCDLHDYAYDDADDPLLYH